MIFLRIYNIHVKVSTYIELNIHIRVFLRIKQGLYNIHIYIYIYIYIYNKMRASIITTSSPK